MSDKDYSEYFKNTFEPDKKKNKPKTAEDVGYSQKEGKQRGKEEIMVVNFDPIPDELKGLGKDKTYCLVTFGCQMNEHDSETIAGILENMGYTSTTKEKEADIVLIILVLYAKMLKIRCMVILAL